MNISVETLSPTKKALNISVDEKVLADAKIAAIEALSQNLKVPGFRSGKVPAGIAEKHLDQQMLQAEVIDTAMNHAYQQALKSKDIRPVLQPQVELKKFVPFTILEFIATVEVLGDIVLADYKKIKKQPPKVVVSTDEISTVIENMRVRLAERKDVARASKEGDELRIDFSGKNQKGEEIKGATGKDYPLLLGSNAFIPGFEDNLIGLKKGEAKTFTLTFPKDYGVNALAAQKVSFDVTIQSVLEIKKDKLDDAFAAKIGPFKTVTELKSDIKKQLEQEKSLGMQRDFEAEIINEITNASKVDLPEGLINEQAEAVLRELQQNIMYRGLTMKEYCDSQGMTEEELRVKEVIPEAMRRLKAGLVLSEISTAEKIDVSEEEINERMNSLQQQYQNDPQMMEELGKPENHRDIVARLLTEKTIKHLMGLVRG